MKITGHTVVEVGKLPSDIEQRTTAFDTALAAIFAVFPEARVLVMIDVNKVTSVVSNMGAEEIRGHIVRHLGEMHAITGAVSATKN